MRPVLQGVLTALAISTTSVAMVASQNTYAALPANALQKAPACDSNPYIDPSVRICVAERNGSAYYFIDTADGTHAEIAVSDDGMTLQQSGPDPVHVAFAEAQARANGNTEFLSGISRRLYQDAVLSIDEVRNGQQSSTWLVTIGAQRIAAPAQRNCGRTGCGGHILAQ